MPCRTHLSLYQQLKISDCTMWAEANERTEITSAVCVSLVSSLFLNKFIFIRKAIIHPRLDFLFYKEIVQLWSFYATRKHMQQIFDTSRRILNHNHLLAIAWCSLCQCRSVCFVLTEIKVMKLLIFENISNQIPTKKFKNYHTWKC